jgi:uroporphyrinogen decarboxylase
LLPNAQPEETVKAVQQFNHCFYNNGGIIGQLEFGPGAKPDNVYAAFETWENFSDQQDKMKFEPIEWRTDS